MSRNKKDSFSGEVIGKMLTHTLTELLDFVPIAGPAMKVIFSNVLLGIEECESEERLREIEKNNENLEEQIMALHNAIKESKIPEEQIMDAVKKEVVAYAKETQVVLPVYMYGVIIYPYEELDGDDVDRLVDLFSGEDERPEEIQSFWDTYIGKREHSYYVNSDVIIINFYDDVKHLSDSVEIIEFIDSLNRFLGGSPLSEYAIF